jgi:Uncharacterized conserved protein
MENKLTVQDYMKLPYSYLIKPVTDEGGSYYYGCILEFKGCQSNGDTFQEAYDSLKEAMEGWIETKLDNGFKVPYPITIDAVHWIMSRYSDMKL